MLDAKLLQMDLFWCFIAVERSDWAFILRNFREISDFLYYFFWVFFSSTIAQSIVKEGTMAERKYFMIIQ